MSNSSETIIGVIDDATSIDFTSHALFFTSTRIIIALTVGLAPAFMDWATLRGALRGSWEQKRTRELAMMTPVGILQADKNNYYFSYTDIKSIILKKRRWRSSVITIILDDGEDTFFFKHNFDEIFRIVSNSMPDKVIVQ